MKKIPSLLFMLVLVVSAQANLIDAAFKEAAKIEKQIKKTDFSNAITFEKSVF